MKEIPQYSSYRATEDGTIFSVKRSEPSACKVTSHSQVSSPQVQIQRDDRSGNHFVPVAVLVASAFHGFHGDGVAVMHLDGDLTNCTAANLAWVDPLDPSSWIEDTAPIPGFPGYFAHATGAIFSARRGRVVRQLELTSTSDGKDVSVVVFNEAGKERLIRAGALMCSAFLGDLNGSVAYADGDRRNIALENVSWVDGSEDIGTLPTDAKAIPGYPGYFVDESAVVYSTVSLSTRASSVFRLTASLDLYGYWCVTLRRDGKQKRIRVHVLVAMAFHGVKDDPKLVARHLDDDRDNNHVSNIEWGTHAENMADRDRNGKTARGSKLHGLTDDDVRDIRRRCDAGEKPFAVGREYGLRHDTTSNIAARRTFTNVSERMT